MDHYTQIKNMFKLRISHIKHSISIITKWILHYLGSIMSCNHLVDSLNQLHIKKVGVIQLLISFSCHLDIYPSNIIYYSFIQILQLCIAIISWPRKSHSHLVQYLNECSMIVLTSVDHSLHNWSLKNINKSTPLIFFH